MDYNSDYIIWVCLFGNLDYNPDYFEKNQGRERNEVIKGQAGMASWRGTRLG